MAPRPGHEVVTSEHRRHSAWTVEGPAGHFNYLHIDIRVRRMTARGCEGGRQA